MSLNRYAAKRDVAEPPIIAALKRAGFEVSPLNKLCDLAVRRSWWSGGLFMLLEVKTGRGKNLTVVKDKRQSAQQNFIKTSKIPIVRTPLDALRAVGVVTGG